jgi:hypothetical protein
MQRAPKKAPVAEVRLRSTVNEASCSDERGFMLIRNKQFSGTMSPPTLAFASQVADHARAEMVFSQIFKRHCRALG